MKKNKRIKMIDDLENRRLNENQEVELLQSLISDERKRKRIYSLTERQSEVLQFIEDTIATRGFPATYRDVAEHFGFASTNAAVGHVKTLRNKGRLRVNDRKLIPLNPEPYRKFADTL